MKQLFWTLLITAMLFPSLVRAQNSDANEIIPRYDVEIIIFKNTKVPKSREFVLPVSSPGKTDPIIDLASPESISAAREMGYELLPGSEFRLLEEATRLVESERYELLAHLAWRQPGVERDKAIPLWIRGGRVFGREYTSIDNRLGVDGKPVDSLNAISPEKSIGSDGQNLEARQAEQTPKSGQRGLYELEGKITIALSRYLHTYADLVLRRPRLAVDPVLDNAAQDEYVALNAADTRILNNHQLREHRRMRSKTLHYLDSPEFGLLVLITPYEVAEGFEEAPIEKDADTGSES